MAQLPAFSGQQEGQCTPYLVSLQNVALMPLPLLSGEALLPRGGAPRPRGCATSACTSAMRCRTCAAVACSSGGRTGSRATCCCAAARAFYLLLMYPLVRVPLERVPPFAPRFHVRAPLRLLPMAGDGGAGGRAIGEFPLL